MWQRKQTLFLALAASSLVLMIFFPIWVGQLNDQTIALYPLHFTSKTIDKTTIEYVPFCITSILAIASATLVLISIKNYKNRLLQIKIGTLNALLMSVTMVLAVYFATTKMRDFHQVGSYGFSMFIPAFAMICNTIANWLIRRDEKLVRDSDRIR